MKICNPFLRLILRRKPISMISPTMFLLSSPSTSSSIGHTNGMLRSRSEDNLKKLGDCMENMDEDVSKLFIEFQQTDLREDPDLFRLLNHYFSTSKGVSQLCESLRTCLERSENNECLLIDEALVDFELEKLGYGGSFEEASFRKTFRDLRNFNAFYNNDDNDLDYCEFLRKFQTCHEDLAKMIVKLEKTMKEIDKKLRRVRGRRVIVTAALLAPVIAVIFLSKLVAGLVPMEGLTAFVASRWRKSTNALKREKTAMSSMERATTVALEQVEKISKLVSRLDTVERSIRVTAEFAVKKRSPVTVAMGEVWERWRWNGRD
ncbi:hypothetical protein ISN45_Aa05g026110 [Arabidopsis thaliana x Arabidopsis arenosa]|uniref:Uncharacterized protein n=1 Tax=Arabidopsis thaliana x Arabidopsis arenosa TaxID=1240361 RepID=A0A8T1ZRQ3_9BRAS|nr:hypothetical protein ISN45_Aa05g026110 [Arabidopsis thaliana x Arabidopsis arenosa]